MKNSPSLIVELLPPTLLSSSSIFQQSVFSAQRPELPGLINSQVSRLFTPPALHRVPMHRIKRHHLGTRFVAPSGSWPTGQLKVRA